MSAASICVTFLVVSVGTCLYTAKCLDGMQQSVFNMALATEASYFQVLRPTSETSNNLVQVSTILRSHTDGSSQELQTQQGLKSNYQQAKRHMNLFQTVVCEPLASTGLEVTAKIKSLTELDEREGGADILFCEVWCDSLQEVQDAWGMLKDLDGVEIVSACDFFAVASYKKNCKVVVSLQGYLTTVVLMEKSLSSWEAQKGLSDAADSLGLLDKTKASAWEVSRLQRDSEVPRCMFVGTALLRLVALSSCYIIGAQIGSKNNYYSGSWGWDPFFGLYDGLHHCTDRYENGYSHECGMNLNLRMLAMTLPFLICFLILLWEMLSCCCCCLCCRKHRRSFKIRPRPTQLWYRRYLGLQGCYYAFKVAALQFLTVVMQGLAKASLFRIIQDTHGSESLRASTAVHCFLVLLLCNILFPAMILVIPNYVFSRVGAALLDAVLDVGYMVTSIWLYAVFATTESLTDIFLSSFLNYMSIYICVAHVLCVCRSLETADWIALFQVPRAALNCKAWKRMICSSAYALALLAFVGIPLGGLVLGAFSDSSHSDAGLCPPCQCSTVAPTSLLLERCVIPTGYVAQGVPDMLEFNLTNRNITEVLPDAFIARGAHQKVRSISLRGNHLRELPEGLFRDLLQQTRIDTVDLADNRIVTLPRTLFHAVSSIGDLHLEGNCLTTLPPGVFHGLTFDYDPYDGYDSTSDIIRILNMSRNKLQVLHADTFRGLQFGQNGILDMSQNKLQVLHADAFHGLKFGRNGILNISHNQLQVLHADAFHGLKFGRNGILNISHNQLQVLHADAFHGLKFGDNCILDMSQNKLQVLHAGAFHGLTFEWYSILDMSQNKLQELHADAFHGLTFRYRGILNISHNKLQVLHADAFHGLTFIYEGILDMSHNQLQVLHADAFQNLTFGQNGILDMSQNKLQVLHADAFHGLKFGRNGILNISQNKLQELHADAFHGLTFGYEGILNISHNQLQVLHADAFQNLTFGQNGILDISHNQLQDLPPKVFDGLSSLYSLNLSHNELVTLSDDAFYGLSFLRSLRLEGNRLRSLGGRPFYWLIRLEELNLQQNQLTDLDEDVFACHVQKVYYYGYQSLKRNLLELNLGGNRLTALPDGLFNGFRKLRTLQLQSNQLARLPQQLFQTLGKVRVMQGDSLIFIVTSHLSNRQIYCTVCNASLVLLRLGLSVAQILHR